MVNLKLYTIVEWQIICNINAYSNFTKLKFHLKVFLYWTDVHVKMHTKCFSLFPPTMFDDKWQMPIKVSLLLNE